MNIEFKNMTTGKTLILGTVGDNYILAKKNYGQVEGVNNTTQFINLIGSNVDSTALAIRPMSFVGIIKTNDKAVMRERKTALNKLINPKDFITVYDGNYAIAFKPDSSIKYSEEAFENTEYYCRFLISATAYEPLFKLKNPKVYYEAVVKAVPVFPLSISKKKGFTFGFIPAITINNVPNNGDVECGFVIRFTAMEGAVTNPKVINNKTEKYIEIATTLTQGDIVEVSTVSGDKYAKLIRGQSEIDIFKYVTKKSTMSMTLNVGINDLTVTAAGNASNMISSIAFTPQWLEVQD